MYVPQRVRNYTAFETKLLKKSSITSRAVIE